MKNELFEFKDILCPVCDSNRSRFLGYRGGEAHHAGIGVKTKIVRCKDCSHQFPNPMPFPKRNLDDLYVDAEEYFRGHDWERKQQASIGLMKNFTQRVSKKGRFLDIGCGTGELMWAAKEAGWEVEGIDPSREFVEIGYKNFGVEGRACTVEEASFPSNYFDAVAMSSIIEHLYDPYSTLREAARVLRPGGWLWFDAPNEDGLYMQFGNFYMRLKGKDWVVVMAPTFPPYHVQGFNKRSVKTLLDRVGLKVRDLDLLGEVWERGGANLYSKKIENIAAYCINLIGNKMGRGIYMSVWVQKP